MIKYFINYENYENFGMKNTDKISNNLEYRIMLNVEKNVESNI